MRFKPPLPPTSVARDLLDRRCVPGLCEGHLVRACAHLNHCGPSTDSPPSLLGADGRAAGAPGSLPQGAAPARSAPATVPPADATAMPVGGSDTGQI